MSHDGMHGKQLIHLLPRAPFGIQQATGGRGGFFFASSAPLQVGMPIEATLRMPAEVTGNSAQEMRCTARVVHVRNEPYGDGRIGFGAEIEKFQTIPAQDRWVS